MMSSISYQEVDKYNVSNEVVIQDIISLRNNIYQITAQLKEHIHFLPGQYIEFITPKGPIPISIASKPTDDGRLEFHIRKVSDNLLCSELFKMLKVGNSIAISNAKGDYHLERIHKSDEMILIAAGTGFAPAKALIESLLPSNKTISLYWLATTDDDFYLKEQLQCWQNTYPHFHYQLILWSRHNDVEILSKELEKDMIKPHALMKVFLSGPYELMHKLKHVMMAFGFDENQLLSDAY